MDKPARETSRVVKEISPYLHMGTSLALTVGLLMWLGVWLDERFGTTPWLLLVCSLFGTVAGMVSFIKSILAGDSKKASELKQ